MTQANSDIVTRAKAAIVGTFARPMREAYLTSFEELAATVTLGLVANVEAGLGHELHRSDIDGWFLSSSTAPEVLGKLGQRNWEASVAANFGIQGRMHVSSCGLEALNHAVHDIKSGDCELALVGGFDKRTDEAHIGDISNKGIDPYLRMWNWDWQSVYSCQASKYLCENGLTSDDLIAVAINDLYNDCRRPDKRLGDFLGLRGRARRRPLYDPLSAYDFAPTRADGAAALMITRPDRAHEFTDHPVYITAAVGKTGSAEFWNQDETLSYPALSLTMEQAAREASVDLGTIGLLSVDTKVTIIAPLVLEGLGLMDIPALAGIAGELERLGEEYGERHLRFPSKQGDRFVLNPNGGSYVCGNLPGVTGLYRAVGMIDQLLNRAPNQVEGVNRIGLVQEQTATGLKQILLILEIEGEECTGGNMG